LVPELPPDVDFDEDEDDCWPLLLWLLLLPLPWLKASWRTREGVPWLLFPELLRGFMFAVFVSGGSDVCGCVVCVLVVCLFGWRKKGRKGSRLAGNILYRLPGIAG
jgi:hypothetical protein